MRCGVIGSFEQVTGINTSRYGNNELRSGNKVVQNHNTGINKRATGINTSVTGTTGGDQVTKLCEILVRE